MCEENCLKFPSVIKEKIKNGEFIFPPNTKFDYDPIDAYRWITRKKGDERPVCMEDFRSYYELGKHGRGINEKDPHYYGLSFSLSKEALENTLQFPPRNLKFAKGKVYPEAGPSEVNEKTSHVCWWLYDNVVVTGFSI